MSVAGVMRAHVVGVAQDATLGDVVDVMDIYQQPVVPVVGTDGRMVGSVSARAVVAWLAETGDHASATRSASLTAVMDTDPPTLGETDDLDALVEPFARGEVAAALVVREGRAVGIVGCAEVCRALVDSDPTVGRGLCDTGPQDAPPR
jgi:predicted transcriptional regulator